MSVRVPVIVMLALSSSAVVAANDPTACNQLGREVALRAAEQWRSGQLDAAARTELAAIAEGVCLEYTQAVVPAAGAVETGAAATVDANATQSGERRSFMGLEIIPPEERVRRPGLKRP